MLEQKVYQSAGYPPGLALERFSDMPPAPISHPLQRRRRSNGVGEAILQ
jgi:hypothetical protein